MSVNVRAATILKTRRKPPFIVLKANLLTKTEGVGGRFTLLRGKR